MRIPSPLHHDFQAVSQLVRQVRNLQRSQQCAQRQIQAFSHLANLQVCQQFIPPYRLHRLQLSPLGSQLLSHHVSHLANLPLSRVAILRRQRLNRALSQQILPVSRRVSQRLSLLGNQARSLPTQRDSQRANPAHNLRDNPLRSLRNNLFRGQRLSQPANHRQNLVRNHLLSPQAHQLLSQMGVHLPNRLSNHRPNHLDNRSLTQVLSLQVNHRQNRVDNHRRNRLFLLLVNPVFNHLLNQSVALAVDQALSLRTNQALSQVVNHLLDQLHSLRGNPRRAPLLSLCLFQHHSPVINPLVNHLCSPFFGRPALLVSFRPLHLLNSPPVSRRFRQQVSQCRDQLPYQRFSQQVLLRRNRRCLHRRSPLVSQRPVQQLNRFFGRPRYHRLSLFPALPHSQHRNLQQNLHRSLL